MTKYIEETKVIGQWVLNNVTRELDLIAPQIAKEAVPGQFVNVQVSRRTAPLLRRPLGIAGVDKKRGVIRLVYRFVGEATNILGDVCSGDRLSVVGPLGHGFDLSAEHPLLVGGGTGLAPLLFLAETLVQKGIRPDVLMGGRTADDLFWKDMYVDLVERMGLTTDDGSLATKGTVMAELPLLLRRIHYDCVYVCGPAPMMKAVSTAVMEKGIKCQVSLEKYMACGLGACLSCSCQGIGRRIKVCQDGPVFWAEEVAEW
jgi:dihydroorotate dehydrogenase electron transfer subunit